MAHVQRFSRDLFRPRAQQFDREHLPPRARVIRVVGRPRRRFAQTRTGTAVHSATAAGALPLALASTFDLMPHMSGVRQCR